MIFYRLHIFVGVWFPFQTVFSLVAIVAGASGGVYGLHGIFGSFPSVFHGLFPSHPYLMRYGHASSSPGIWQTLIRPASQGAVAQQTVVSAPLTVKSDLQRQVVTLRHPAGLPLFLRPTPIVIQAPVQAPVTAVQVEAPKAVQGGAASAASVVFKAADNPAAENAAPAAVTFKVAASAPAKVEGAVSVPVPVIHQLAPGAPFTYNIGAPLPFKVQGSVPVSPVQQVVPAAPVIYRVNVPKPVKIEGASPVPVFHHVASAAPVNVRGSGPVSIVQQVAPAATIAYKAPVPVKVEGSVPVSAVHQVAAAAPVTYNVAPAVAIAPAAAPVASVAGVAPVAAAPAPVTLNVAPSAAIAAVAPVGAVSPTQSQYHSQDEIGQYSFGYYNSLSSRAETRDFTGTVRGAFSYVDPTGQVQTQHYVADNHGFRVAGTNLPVGHGSQVVDRTVDLTPAAPVVYAGAPVAFGKSLSDSKVEKSDSSAADSKVHVVFAHPVDQEKSDAADDASRRDDVTNAIGVGGDDVTKDGPVFGNDVTVVNAISGDEVTSGDSASVDDAAEAAVVLAVASDDPTSVTSGEQADDGAAAGDDTTGTNDA